MIECEPIAGKCTYFEVAHHPLQNINTEQIIIDYTNHSESSACLVFQIIFPKINFNLIKSHFLMHANAIMRVFMFVPFVGNFLAATRVANKLAFYGIHFLLATTEQYRLNVHFYLTTANVIAAAPTIFIFFLFFFFHSFRKPHIIHCVIWRKQKWLLIISLVGRE